MTAFFHCLVPVLPQVYMNLHSDMLIDLLFVYSSLVRLNLHSGPNPHISVNRDVASQNPFGGRGRYYRIDFRSKNTFLPCRKSSWAWRRGDLVCVLSVVYRSPPKPLGSTEWVRPFTLTTSNLPNGHLGFNEWICICRRLGRNAPTLPDLLHLWMQLFYMGKYKKAT